MPDLLLYFITAACWLAPVGAMALRAARPAVAAGSPAARRPRFDAVLVPVALVLHGILLYRRVIVPEGLDLGVANAISLLVWLTVLIYWLGGLAYTGVGEHPRAHGAGGRRRACCCRRCCRQATWSTYGGDPLFAAALRHRDARLQPRSSSRPCTRCVMLAEEKWLHRGALPPLLRSLAAAARDGSAALPHPPRRVRDAHAHGRERRVLLRNSSSASPFKANHKTVFAFISMADLRRLARGDIYFRGWRGRKAVNWTLAGFISLLLAYVGSQGRARADPAARLIGRARP